jgi:hypothetical protein
VASGSAKHRRDRGVVEGRAQSPASGSHGEVGTLFSARCTAAARRSTEQVVAITLDVHLARRQAPDEHREGLSCLLVVGRSSTAGGEVEQAGLPKPDTAPPPSRASTSADLLEQGGNSPDQRQARASRMAPAPRSNRSPLSRARVAVDDRQDRRHDRHRREHPHHSKVMSRVIVAKPSIQAVHRRPTRPRYSARTACRRQPAQRTGKIPS